MSFTLLLVNSATKLHDSLFFPLERGFLVNGEGQRLDVPCLNFAKRGSRVAHVGTEELLVLDYDGD